MIGDGVFFDGILVVYQCDEWVELYVVVMDEEDVFVVDGEFW